MKKLFKSIIAAMLCAIIAISAIGTDTACAAEKEMIMNVKFNKKTIDVRKRAT